MPVGNSGKAVCGANLTGESRGMKYIGPDIAIRPLPQSELCGRAAADFCEFVCFTEPLNQDTPSIFSASFKIKAPEWS